MQKYLQMILRKKNDEHFFPTRYLYIFLHSSEMHFDLVTEKILSKIEFSSPRNFGLIKKSENNFCIPTFQPVCRTWPIRLVADFTNCEVSRWRGKESAVGCDPLD